MKKTWEVPTLEVLDVSMTMKHHGGNGNEPGEPNPDPDPLES